MANLFPTYQTLPEEIAGVTLLGALSLSPSLIYRGKMGDRAVVLKLGNPFLSSSLQSVRKEISVQRYLSRKRHHRALKTGETHISVFEQKIEVPYLVTALAEKTLAEANLAEREYLDALIAVSDALLALHGKGWVHGDVKGDNIFLLNGKAYLADFGSVALSGTIVRRSSLSHHQAPDARYSSKTDIYALGVLVFQYYCRGDFLAQQLRGLRSMKFKADPKAKVSRLVQSCCAPDPRRREGSLLKVRQAIRDLRRSL